MTDVMDDARRIKRGILDFIHTYGCEQAPEEAFGALARDVFIYQYTYDLPYRRYCAAKRVTPATLKDWREIPPMPVDGFKHLDLSTIPTEQCKAVFMTSGTTHGGKMRGRNFHPDLEVWDESMIGAVPSFHHAGSRAYPHRRDFAGMGHEPELLPVALPYQGRGVLRQRRQRCVLRRAWTQVR